MPKFGSNQPCPCFSGRKYKKCCGPIHRGRSAQTPEALMRSRFSAYAIGLVEHIMLTTDRAGPHWSADEQKWRSEITHFMTTTEFLQLSVLDAETRSDSAWIHFEAQLRQGGSVHQLSETSRFFRRGQTWTYYAALDEPAPSEDASE